MMVVTVVTPASVRHQTDPGPLATLQRGGLSTCLRVVFGTALAQIPSTPSLSSLSSSSPDPTRPLAAVMSVELRYGVRSPHENGWVSERRERALTTGSVLTSPGLWRRRRPQALRVDRLPRSQEPEGLLCLPCWCHRRKGRRGIPHRVRHPGHDEQDAAKAGLQREWCGDISALYKQPTGFRSGRYPTTRYGGSSLWSVW